MADNKTVKYAAITLVAIVVGLVIGWYVAGPSVAPAPVTPVEGPIVKTHEVRAAEPGEKDTDSTPEEPTRPEVMVREVAEAPTWDDQLSEVIGNPGMTIDEKVDHLFNLFTNVPPDGQVEIAGHLSNLLVTGDDYSRMAKLVADPKYPPAVADALFDDLIGRGNAIRFPLFIAIAGNPKHPKAADAKEQLVNILDHDYGNDWHTWEVKLAEWQKENPE